MYNKQYYLMNKNSIVLVVTKDNESKAFCSIDEVRDIEYAPFMFIKHIRVTHCLGL